MLIGLVLMGLLFLWPREKPSEYVGLDQVIESKELVVITRNNAHCYYLYREQPQGFEYDLARAFANYLGVRLRVQIGGQWEAMIPALLQGKGALVAASLSITPERAKKVAFSAPYLAVQQHIIVHRDNLSIQGPADLAGKTVHIRKGTYYQGRLEALQAQGIDLRIQRHPNLPTEELIRRVAQKEIEVTIADSNIALLNRRYYPQTLVAGAISEKSYLGWAVHPQATRLLARINDFFETIQKNGRFSRIYQRYYAEVAFFDYDDISAFHQRIQNRLPRFLPYIKKHAQKHGFDWRLIAAQIYQESHFDPRAKSPNRAYGLMQLTYGTAYGQGLAIENLYDPEKNIATGVQYLKKLYRFYDQAKGMDRLFIALAAYNIGQGHILDARDIARDKNLDPNQWESLARTLPLLSRPAYYSQSRYGYARGSEAVQYIQRIMAYYDVLKRKDIRYPEGENPESGLDSRGLLEDSDLLSTHP